MGRDNSEYNQDNEQYESSMGASNVRGEQERPGKPNKLELNIK
jgi:hypothetical protein